MPLRAKENGFTTCLFTENPEFSSDTGFESYMDYVNEDIHHKIFSSTYSPSKAVEEVSIQAGLDVLSEVLVRENRLKNIVNVLFGGTSKIKRDTLGRNLTFPHRGRRVLRHIDSYLNSSSGQNLLLTNILEPHNPYYAPPEEAAASLGFSFPKDERIALKATDDTRRYLLKKSPSLPVEAKRKFGCWQDVFSRKHDIYEAHIREADTILQKFYRKHVGVDDLLITVGDHGQLFGEERQVGHQTSFHPNGINVAFGINPPDDWGDERMEITEPVSLSGIGSAVVKVLEGAIQTNTKFVETVVANSQKDGFVTCCVDGPTWMLENLQEGTYNENKVEEYKTRKLGKITNQRMYVYESPWDCTDITETSFEIEGYDRTIVGTCDHQTRYLSEVEENWLSEQVNGGQGDPAINSRLEALGYK